jgi:hypothetical protein
MHQLDLSPVLSKFTLKVEKENAYAWINGFKKDDGHHYTTIYTADEKAKSLTGNFEKHPKLITLFKGKPRGGFTLSKWGRQLMVDNWSPPLQHIAVLHSVFEIKNCSEIWDILCHNGVFDIWEPEAPLRRLGGSQTSRKSIILLLRIFRIKEDLTEEVEKDDDKGYKKGNPHFDYLRGRVGHMVHLDKPIIWDEDFDRIRTTLKESVEEYIHNEKVVCHTIGCFPCQPDR